MAIDPLELADAVVAELVDAPAGTFATFAAERTFLPRWELAEESGIRVYVIPNSQSEEDRTRGDLLLTTKIDIGVCGRVVKLAKGGDEIVELAQAIKRYFRRRKLLVDATVTGVEHLALYAPEQLEKHGVLVNVLRITVQHTEDV